MEFAGHRSGECGGGFEAGSWYDGHRLNATCCCPVVLVLVSCWSAVFRGYAYAHAHHCVCRHREGCSSSAITDRDRVFMDSIEEALDHAEGDEASHVDVCEQIAVGRVPFPHALALS